MKIKVIIHDAEEGGYWAEALALPGCFTQADTSQELIKNIYEAIECHLTNPTFMLCVLHLFC